MEKSVPRILLAGTASGCGKTSISCALLQAFKKRGLKTAAFKCGPDYIDPMYHKYICGDSCNLDSFFFSDNCLKYLLHKNSAGADISLIEGVMGFYDGRGLVSTKGSSYELSEITGTPVVLLIDAKGAALSVLAQIQGFLNFCPDNKILGVILNRCSGMSYKILAPEIEERFKIKALGYMPNIPDCTIPGRHLGLLSPEETENFNEKLEQLSDQAEKSIDIDGILKLAQKAEKLSFDPPNIPKIKEKVKIAVAKDRAFCFYYEDNLKLLEEMGAETVEFSPVSDEKLPENIQGLYLGGGYPELYLKELSENKTMLETVNKAVSEGLPTIAECGGFMYLTKSIDGYPMAGIIPTDCHAGKKLKRFGYIRLRAERDSMLCRKGSIIPAHEFHYWDAENCGDAFRAEKSESRSWDCVYASDSLYAGYPHLNFYADPSFAENFLRVCIKEKNND